MRIGLFSDVHGNAVGFDALLADLERRPVDRLVCLGDVIQGGPQPVECLERLRSLDCRVVMGNADWYVLTGEPGAEPETERHRRARTWTLSQLSEADLDYIRSFAPTVDEPPVLAFHGSPGSWDEIILPSTPEDDFRRMLGDADSADPRRRSHAPAVRPAPRRLALPQSRKCRALVRPRPDAGGDPLRPLGCLGSDRLRRRPVDRVPPSTVRPGGRRRSHRVERPPGQRPRRRLARLTGQATLCCKVGRLRIRRGGGRRRGGSRPPASDANRRGAGSPAGLCGRDRRRRRPAAARRT